MRGVYEPPRFKVQTRPRIQGLWPPPSRGDATRSPKVSDEGREADEADKGPLMGSPRAFRAAETPSGGWAGSRRVFLHWKVDTCDSFGTRPAMNAKVQYGCGHVCSCSGVF